MELRRLGRDGPLVSRLALGLLTWGQRTVLDEARAQLLAFVGVGGTMLDTAYAYADGRSEEMLGALLGSVVSRDDVVIATKAGLEYTEGERFTNTSADYMLACLDTSLARMGVDDVDLWQVHVWSDDTTLHEVLAALDVAVSSGRARHVGVSNWSARHTRAAAFAQLGPGSAAIASTQMEYSLLNRSIETEVLPVAHELDVGVLPWSPLCRGVLTGKYRAGTPDGSRAAGNDLMAAAVSTYRDSASDAIVDLVLATASDLGWTPTEVALAWVRDRPGVVAPIVGARTLEQLQAALDAEERTLPLEVVGLLDDASRERVHVG